MKSILKRNAFTEWIQQVKRMSKNADYMAIDVIDTVISFIWIINKKLVTKDEKFFTELCLKYHKIDVQKLIKSHKAINSIFIEHQGGNGFHDFIKKTRNKNCQVLSIKDCRLLTKFSCWITQYADSSIKRCKTALSNVAIQWCEVADFMFERPELVNISIIDEYTRDEIEKACVEYNKLNPFDNSISKRFGKFYMDEKGLWKPERRHRF